MLVIVMTVSLIAYCNHTCTRTSYNVGVCYNTAASFDCRTCSVTGTQHFADSGVITSPGYPWSYTSYMRKNWHIKYTVYTVLHRLLYVNHSIGVR